jgi:hypothetical protein
VNSFPGTFLFGPLASTNAPSLSFPLVNTDRSQENGLFDRGSSRSGVIAERTGINWDGSPGNHLDPFSTANLFDQALVGRITGRSDEAHRSSEEARSRILSTKLASLVREKRQRERKEDPGTVTGF